MAGAIAGAAGAAFHSPLLFAQPKAAGAKRLTLLHLTDTHAQLETHPEYLPGMERMESGTEPAHILDRAV